MLTERERHGMAELLGRMDPADLVSLAQTVTSRLLVADTPAEAVENIILHTDKATDLLKRKKIKKELLFKYLHSKRVPIESVADKAVHVSRVLETWQSGEVWEENGMCDSDNSLEGPPPAPVPSRNASHTSLCSLDLSRDGFGPSMLVNRVQDTSFHPLRRTESSASVMCFDEASNSSLASCPPSLPTSFIPTSLPSTLSLAPPSISSQQCQEMAINFARWYFQLLNSSVDTDQTDWGPSHFWPDSSAKVSLMSGAGEQESLEAHHSASEVCDMLVQVMRRHRLTCNPNLCEEGVRGRLEAHGLVLVLVCGTLHTSSNVCGVFEQVFGLVRDPGAQNNWKIKNTEARLVAGEVQQQPKLTSSSLAIALS